MAPAIQAQTKRTNGIVEEHVPDPSPIRNAQTCVSIKTGDLQGAGTSANVTPIIKGQGKSRNIAINPHTSFSRNTTEKLCFPTPDWNIEFFSLEHDGSGAGAAWYIESVSFDNHFGSGAAVPVKVWLEAAGVSTVLYPLPK